MITFIIFIIANAITICAQTIITTGIKYLMIDFAISSSTAQLSYSIFLLVLGIMIPPSAYIIHRFKIKDILLASLGVFIIGSLLAYISPNFWILLIGRILQAGGTEILIPIIQIVLFKVVPEEKWTIAMGAFGFIVGIVPALGPTIGGFIIDILNWRAIFATFAIITALILVLAIILINFELEREEYPLDVPSLILSIVFCIGIMIGCSNIAEYGTNILYVILPIILGLISMIIFVKRQKEIENPLINLHVLKNKYFISGMLFASLLYFIICSANVIMPLYAQNISYYSATESGLILLPGTLTMIVLNFLSSLLVNRIGFKKVLILSCLFTGTSLIAMMNYSINSSMNYLILTQIIRCIGVGLGLTPAITWTMSIVSDNIENATAINNTARQLFGAIGSAISVVVLTICANGSIAHNIQSLNSFKITSFVLLVITIISLVIVIYYVREKIELSLEQ